MQMYVMHVLHMMHMMHMSGHSGSPIDVFLFGMNSAGLALFYGDVATAKVGWEKMIDAWVHIESLCKSGERQWSEYLFEDVVGCVNIAMMLACGERALARRFHAVTLGGVALRDADAAAHYTFANYPFLWQAPSHGWQRRDWLKS